MPKRPARLSGDETGEGEFSHVVSFGRHPLGSHRERRIRIVRDRRIRCVGGGHAGQGQGGADGIAVGLRRARLLRRDVRQHARHRRRSAAVSDQLGRSLQFDGRPVAGHLQKPDRGSSTTSRSTAASGTNSGPARSARVSRHWQEMDWWAGVSVGFAKYWTFSAESLNFVFPNAPPGAGTVYNYNFALSFDDSFSGWPVVFNPYVSVFYNDKGGSTVVLGKTIGCLPRHIGMNPTISFAQVVRRSADDLVPDLGRFRARGILEPQRRHDELLRPDATPCRARWTTSASTPPACRPSTRSKASSRNGSAPGTSRPASSTTTSSTKPCSLRRCFTCAATTFPGAKDDIVIGNGGVRLQLLISPRRRLAAAPGILGPGLACRSP